jgi:putative ABC transport system permease protein
MGKNYWIIAVRSLQRNKSYSIINILGLTLGVAATLLLFMVVRYEQSFDEWHAKKDRTYRVLSGSQRPDGKGYISAVAFPVPAAIRKEYPALEEVVPTLYDYGQQVIVPDNKGGIAKTFKENIMYTDPSFFRTFDFPVLAGDVNKSLGEPNNALLTKTTAEKYFGDWHTAMGKTLRINDRQAVTVGAILQDFPANTDFPVTIMASFATVDVNGKYSASSDWVTTSSQMACYVVLPPSSSPTIFSSSLDAFIRRHRPAEDASGAKLEPLSDIHYNSQLDNYSGSTFSVNLIHALELIGLFLLLIACINFINLATAQAVNRSREVGVRKVLGSSRKQLLGRFMAETAILTLMAVLGAVLVASLLVAPLNKLLQLQLSLNLTGNFSNGLFLLAVWGIVTFLAGFYPALVLSGFNPINALKSRVSAGSARGISLRRGLVVLQFVIAQALIIGVLVVASQMHYFRHAEMGFNRDAILTVSIPGDSVVKSRLGAFRQELMRLSGISAVSYSFTAPADFSSMNSDFRFDNSPTKTPFGASFRWADTGYFRLYGLSMVAGRIYQQADTMREYVINETCARMLGLKSPRDAIGKKINLWGGQHIGMVVGVVKDYHVGSLRDSLQPVVMSTWNLTYATANIKVSGAAIGRAGSEPETVAGVEATWSRFFPAYSLDYSWLDEKLTAFYAQEEQLSVLYRVFAGIAVFISCLGLYGLLSFMAAQRNKEIGIRKVLGASTGNIVLLLSKEFTLLILVAFAVAAPLAGYFMQKWLVQYTYRIQLGWGFFVGAMLGSMAIAAGTVGWRAVQAALANPVKSLRSE